ATKAAFCSVAAEIAACAFGARVYLNGTMGFFLHYLPYCRDDSGIGAAAADVSAHHLANLVIVRCNSLIDQGCRRHDLARRAESALDSVVLYEGRLYRVEAAFSR